MRDPAQYKYDTSVPDQNPNPLTGEYPQDFSQAGAKVTIGSLTLETDPTYDSFYGRAFTNVAQYYGGVSSFIAAYFHNKPLANGARVYSVVFTFADQTGNSGFSESLPTTAPNVAALYDKEIIINGGTDTDSFHFVIDLETATLGDSGGGGSMAGDFTVSPAAGSFLRLQQFDAALFLPPGSQVMVMYAKVNGNFAGFTFGDSCFMAPPNSQNRAAIFCPNATWQLQDGMNHVEWHVRLMNGTELQQTVDWEMIQ